MPLNLIVTTNNLSKLVGAYDNIPHLFLAVIKKSMALHIHRLPVGSKPVLSKFILCVKTIKDAFTW